MPTLLRSTVRTLGRKLWRRLRRTQAVSRPPYAGVIEEAERCQHDPQRAARFRESGGPQRLRTAIDAADAANHDEWAARGRAASRVLTDEEPAEPIYRPSKNGE